MFEKLIYTNSLGKSVEFSTSSLYHVNIRKDVNGLRGVKTKIYSEQIVDADGETETGYHVEIRDITINGTFNTTIGAEQDRLSQELSAILSPFYTGVLRWESGIVREIDVRVETIPDPSGTRGNRKQTFSIDLVALNPNWRALNEIETAIVDSGTTIVYTGTKAAGMEIEITAKEDGIDIGDFSATNGDNVETITFRNAGGINLDTDDVLIVDTAPGEVSIQLNDVNALERVDFANTVFCRLFPGVNVLTWSVSLDEYSASETYALGAFVEYSGALYECTTAITTPEAWTSGHWTEVTAADLFDVTVRYTPQYISL